MRIRRCASRLLGSAYTSAPPDPAPCLEPELQLPPLASPLPPGPCPSPPDSYDGEGGSSAYGDASVRLLCDLSLSPWDLMVQFDLSDPQEQEEFDDMYLISMSFRSSWAVPTGLPAASVEEGREEIAVAMVDPVKVKPREKQVSKKMAARKTKDKECELKRKKATVKAEEGEGDVADGGAQLIWTCKKNDGKKWYCHRLVRQPNSLCMHHSDQKRMCNKPLSDSMSAASAPAVSKLSISCSKPRRKRPVVDVAEGFYYYAGFGPSRSKRHCSSSSLQQPEYSPPPVEENEAPEDHITAPAANQAQAVDSADHQAAGQPICDDDTMIAGGDEESSDGEHRAVGVRKNPSKKRWRKPVKARSLKSLM